jgi:outer membrane protein
VARASTPPSLVQTKDNMMRLFRAPDGAAKARVRVVPIYMFLIAALTGFDARAATLTDTFIAAFEHNPLLAAQRERLKAAGEDVAIARAGYFPKASASAEASRGRAAPTTARATAPDLKSAGVSYGASIEQPLFDGFKTVRAVSEAADNERAGGQELRAVEHSTLADAAAAYAGVIRDGTIQKLRAQSLKAIDTELGATRLRLKNGDATQTDVAQVIARRSASVANLALAEANAAASVANFQRITGRGPGALQPPLPSSAVPARLEQAIEIASVESPAVIASLHRRAASRNASQKIEGDFWPRVSVRADYTHASYDAPETAAVRTIDASLSARVVVPLTDGGETLGRLRQSRFIEAARDQELRDARDRTRAAVVTAWSRLQAAREQLIASRIGAEASKTALRGIREEHTYAQRTTLDVLNGEQEVVEAAVRQAQSEYDIVQSSYGVAQAIGRLSLEHAVPQGSQRSGHGPVRPDATLNGWKATVTR